MRPLLVFVVHARTSRRYFVTPALYNAIVFRLPAYKRARNTIWTMFDRKVAEARIAIAAREVQGDDRGDNILAMIIEKEAAGTTISHNEITDELFEMLVRSVHSRLDRSLSRYRTGCWQ